MGKSSGQWNALSAFAPLSASAINSLLMVSRSSCTEPAVTAFTHFMGELSHPNWIEKDAILFREANINFVRELPLSPHRDFP